jgi:hypothetical protein
MDIGDSGPVLFWVEDREDTVVSQRLIVRQSGIKHYIFGTPAELMSVLDETIQGKDADRLRIGFAIDLMLFGVVDLRSFDIDDAPTGNGVHAGYVFADRILRATSSRFLKKPICFLTERMLDQQLRDDVDRLGKRGGAAIDLVQKYKDAELDKFTEFLKRI